MTSIHRCPGANDAREDGPKQPPSPFLRREAASRYLREQWGLERAPSTLAKLACKGAGPRFRRAGRIPFYTRDDLNAWAAEVLREPEADLTIGPSSDQQARNR
jgi:hypothetical protein